jgi:hypothetical protein
MHLQLLGGALIALAFALCFHAWRERRRVEASQSWPSTYGTVVRAEVVHERRSPNTGSVTNVFKADIRYQYVVDSQELEGSSVTIGGDLSTGERQRAEARVRIYPVGSSVTVFYDPQDPKTACLERKQEGAGLVYAIAGGFFLTGLLVLTGLVG